MSKAKIKAAASVRRRLQKQEARRLRKPCGPLATPVVKPAAGNQ